jgi:hypothetical protein
MDTLTRTFPANITRNYISNSIIEFCHFRDMTFDADERIAIYLEAFFCNLSLKSFSLGVTPNFDGSESEAEKMAKFTAAENKSQKVGLRILGRKNDAGEWQEKAEIILVNRGRKDYFDLLQPYLSKSQVRIFEKNDALALQLIDYGNGLLTPVDSLGIEAAFTVTIAKKNSLEAFEARLASIELALKDTINNIPSNSLLGRNTGVGAVEVISQLKFATAAMIDQAIIDLGGGAPGALNTLIELANALNNDANFASNVINSLATKAPIDKVVQLTNRSFGTGAFNANTWTLNHFAGVKWVDGAGGTNLNLPTQVGMLFQIDSLFNTTDMGKYRIQHYYGNSRYFLRAESNGVWGSWREITMTVM